MNLTDSSIPLLKEAYAYGVVEHPFPLNLFLKDWNLGSEFYQSVKIGIVQYVMILSNCVILMSSPNLPPVVSMRSKCLSCCSLKSLLQMILKMICAVLATILQSFGVYGEGKFEWKYG